ncbi:MAG TPA: isoamylase early set domain-containing protein [Gemmatimonadaceae bacterium]
MRDFDETTMSVELARAIRVLREGAEPSPALRDRLLRELAEAPRPAGRAPRVWTIRPWAAVAAGLCCVVLGGSAVALFSERHLDVARVTADVVPATVRFRFDASGAGRVALAGDFNAWSPTSLPLTRAPDGRTWVIDVPLSPGRYAYAFVVDGVLRQDPGAPRATDDDFGAPSSVVLVRGS